MPNSTLGHYDTPLDAFVSYFKLKNRQISILEREGTDGLIKNFNVTKSQLAKACAEFDPETELKKSTDKLLDIIRRYYFVKYPWYGELAQYMDVTVSNICLTTIHRGRRKNFMKIEYLCLYIHLLSEG